MSRHERWFWRWRKPEAHIHAEHSITRSKREFRRRGRAFGRRILRRKRRVVVIIIQLTFSNAKKQTLITFRLYATLLKRDHHHAQKKNADDEVRTRAPVGYSVTSIFAIFAKLDFQSLSSCSRVNIILLGVVNVVVFGIAAERLNLKTKEFKSWNILLFSRVSPLGHVCFRDSGFRVLNP